MNNERTLVKRSDKVSFLGCYGSGSTETFNRMRGFTTLSSSKNSKEYTRQYVDEEFDTTDVTGFAPSIDFGFDQYTNDPVHDELVEILDNEYTGSEARRNIVTVDFSKSAGTNTYEAVEREYSVIGDTEGDSMDAYTYSGTFRSSGKRIPGTATVSDGGATITFSPTASL